MKLYHFSEFEEKNYVVCLGEWETDEVIFREEFSKIQKGWSVVDVGSQFGYYAIEAAKLVGNGGRVLAIEAHPRVFQVLKMNLKLYGLTENVVAICKAAGTETGKTTLYESTSLGGATIASGILPTNINRNRLLSWLEFAKSGKFFKITRERFAPARYVIPVDTLDRIAEQCNIKEIDLIKIDVEGAELSVLEGARGILERDRPILLVEVHFVYVWKPQVLYGMLQRLGYSLTIEKRTQKALVVAYPRRR